jgi:hypothetical protein
MIMKWLNFNSIIGMAVLSLLFYTENVAAQTDKNDTKQKIDTIQTTQSKYSKYDKRIHRFRKGWNSLIPTHNKIQYAGNMGMFSEPVGITEKEISGKRICSSASYPNMTPIGLR